jgi:methyl-CpG-binding domain protein 4
LVVCIFLNKTRGERAIPHARRFLQEYPEPLPLSKAAYKDIQPFFATLGLFRRASWLIDLAKEWLINPPTAGVIHKKSSRDGVVLESEVAHLKGVGKYASDAWRIFCKDDLYKRAGHENKAPEWKKVQAEDKELVAYLKWRRMKEESTSIEQSPRTSPEDVSDKLTSQLERLDIGKTVQNASVSGSPMLRITVNDRRTEAAPRRIILRSQPSPLV